MTTDRTFAGRDLDVEVDRWGAMIRRAVLVVGVAAPVVVGVAWLVRDTHGATTAAVVLAFVLAVFVSTAASLRWAAGRGPTMVQAVALGGAITRLSLYGLVAVTLGPTDLLDRPTLAVTAPLAILALLAAEVALVQASPAFRMIDASARPPTARDGADTHERSDTTRTIA